MSLDVEKVVREYIDKTIHLSLATANNNRPWVCELHFAYDNELNLYFRSLRSRRHSQEIAANPRVAGNIVRQHSLEEVPVGVYFEGTAMLLAPGTEQNKAFQCLKDRLKASNEILEESKQEEGHQFYKISVEAWYVFGVFNDAPAQKYKLKWSEGLS